MKFKTFAAKDGAALEAAIDNWLATTDSPLHIHYSSVSCSSVSVRAKDPRSGAVGTRSQLVMMAVIYYD